MRARPLLFLLCPAALLGACATPSGGKGPPPITPTERYVVTASQTPEQIAFAAHAEGLSAGQRNALKSFVAGWNDSGGGSIHISAPAEGGEIARRSAWAIKAGLEQLGVTPASVEIAAYHAESPGAPVLIVYQRWTAEVPRCNTGWTSLTATRNNETQKNFGCALNANLAAQVANPRDLVRPRDMDPSDAARRGVVTDKYRRGEPTGAKYEDPNAGKVSTAVQN